MKNLFKNHDFALMILPILLGGFGVVMVYSASMVTASVAGLGSTYFLKKQLLFFGIGLFIFLILSKFKYQKLQKFDGLIIGVTLLLLVSVLFLGETINNATRAIRLGGFNFQPAEFAKLGLIIYLSSVYAKKERKLNDFTKEALPPLALVALALVFIFLQPDLGTMGIILTAIAVIVFSAGLRIKHLLGLGLLTVATIGVLALTKLTDTRLGRFSGAYRPFESPEEEGFHLIQSYLAIGNSGLSGEGLGQSVQKLGYLWGAHTDFIMSIIAEELGITGSIITIGILAAIVLRGLYLSTKSVDRFGTLLAIGISTMIGAQALINLGSISGILPITGVPLPFISYGGSSIILMFAATGILNNIAKQVNEKEMEPEPSNESSTSEDFISRRPVVYPGGKTS